MSSYALYTVVLSAEGAGLGRRIARRVGPLWVDCGHSRLRSPCLKPAVRVRPPRSRGLDRRPRKSSFGHRRLRAAAIAGLATAPCMVRAMTDEEARRAQIAEKLQRADMHPIEEAEGFQALIDRHREKRRLFRPSAWIVSTVPPRGTYWQHARSPGSWPGHTSLADRIKALAISSPSSRVASRRGGRRARRYQ